jgi:hypothetical protein
LGESNPIGFEAAKGHLKIDGPLSSVLAYYREHIKVLLLLAIFSIVSAL